MILVLAVVAATMSLASGVVRTQPSGEGSDRFVLVLEDGVRNRGEVAGNIAGRQEATFSNFGSCVDVWAPGVGVLSTK